MEYTDIPTGRDAKESSQAETRVVKINEPDKAKK